MSAGGPGDPPAARVEYRDPGRSYVSVAVLAGLITAGFLVDWFVVGGGGAHVFAWAAAFVLVVGIDALAVHASRLFRTVVVTADEVRVGDARVPRTQIVGHSDEADADTAVLGGPGSALPRGFGGLALHLADGTSIVVPARNPQRLAAAIAAAPHVPEIRPAGRAELLLVAEIDERADALFRAAGIELPDIAPGAGPRSVQATFVVDRPPVGFVQVGELDGCAHIWGLAVLPGRMRRGYGSALLEQACTWAREQGYPAVTLTTFADVSWNAPFYAARGFVEVPRPGPELAEVRAEERRVGLDAAGRRIAMRRPLRDRG